jgi:hypothetical protein
MSLLWFCHVVGYTIDQDFYNIAVSTYGLLLGFSSGHLPSDTTQRLRCHTD